MTPEQFSQLLAVLRALADKSYTISGAADWPMLLTLGGLLMAAVAAMWADLRSKLTDHRTVAVAELKDMKAENEKGHDLLWEAMRACQDDCCPRRREHSRE